MSDEKRYPIEEILDSKKVRGQMEYLVKWEGYGSEENSWEPYENLAGDDVFEEYDQKRIEELNALGRQKPASGKKITPINKNTTPAKKITPTNKNTTPAKKSTSVARLKTPAKKPVEIKKSTSVARLKIPEKKSVAINKSTSVARLKTPGKKSAPIARLKTPEKKSSPIARPTKKQNSASKQTSPILTIVETPPVIRFTQLPFYDVKQEIINPRILTIDERQGELDKHSLISFEIPADIANLLKKSPDNDLPRYEIQLRLALHNTKEEQPDDFPNEVKIMLNGLQVQLPPQIRTPITPGQPNPIKYESRPLNLTPYLKYTSGINEKLQIEWRQDARVFVIGIWLVQQLSWEAVRDRFLLKEDVQYTMTRKDIKKRLAGDSDDDVSMDSLKVSLICPCSRSRMITPIRSPNCTHLQCFDLGNYLQLNKLKPTWKCPVCAKHCPYNSLMIDIYFLDVIKRVGKNVNEVELLPNGDWKSESVERETLATPINSINKETVATSIQETPVSSINKEVVAGITHDQAIELDSDGNHIITLDDD